MTKCLLLPAFIGLLSWSSAAMAEEQKLVLHVDNMFCRLCEATVSRAISAMPGVVAVEVDREAQAATVIYDDDLVSPADLASAVTGAGYPASPMK